MSEDRVKIRIENHVAEVAMVRSDKHNALDGSMFRALTEAALGLLDEQGLRAVVLHGEGPSFCSGIDVGWLASGGGEGFAEEAVRRDDFGANLFQRVATAWMELPMPVIAAVHGNCYGGGLQIALGADIRITAPDAKWSIREAHWGLVPDMGITATLPRLLRLDLAKELTYTAGTIDGEQATRIGLTTRVDDDPLAAARDLAAEIRRRSPDAVRAAKRLFESAWHEGGKRNLELETELQKTLIGSPNQMAAVMAGVSGETPEFADPEPGGRAAAR
jgi:enoyl-CoA hydratase/carnithine racemase